MARENYHANACKCESHGIGTKELPAVIVASGVGEVGANVYTVATSEVQIGMRAIAK